MVLCKSDVNGKMVELFCRYLFVFGIRVWWPGRFCRSSSPFFHWPAELLTP